MIAHLFRVYKLKIAANFEALDKKNYLFIDYLWKSNLFNFLRELDSDNLNFKEQLLNANKENYLKKFEVLTEPSKTESKSLVFIAFQTVLS